MVGPPVLLLGGTVNALCIARSLSRAGIEVHAFADGLSPSLVRHSRYVRTFREVRGPATAQHEWLEWLPFGPSGAVALPCSDPGMELVARHRELLLDLGYAPIEANDEIALDLLDKARTYALAEKTGIEVPCTRTVRSSEDIDDWVSSGEFPCALKPLHSHTSVNRIGAKVLIAHDAASLRAHAARLFDMGIESLITEIVTGDESTHCSYYGYLDADGEPVGEFTKRKLRQYPPHFGWGCYHVTSWEPAAAELGLRFLQGIGARGMNVVEFKREARDGRLKLIECNPRMTAAIELVRLDGADFPRLAYERAAGKTGKRFAPRPTGRRTWHPVADTRAFFALHREGELSTLDWAVTLRPPLHLPIADLLDPVPSVMNGWHGTCNGVKVAARHLCHSGGLAGAGPAAPSDFDRAAGPLRGQRSFGGRLYGRQPAGGRPSVPTRLLMELAHRGKLGAEIGWRLDMARATRSLAGTGLERNGASVDPADQWHAFHRRLWRAAADAVGAELEDLGSGFLELRRHGRRTIVWQSRVMLGDPVTLRMSQDKSLQHTRFAAAGLPVAAHLEFSASDLEPALEFLVRAPGSCVVKPADGTAGGHGVTCGIVTPDDLARACLRARRWDQRLLLEHQVAGDEYRLLFLDGELLDVVRRHPPVLVGDGRSSISALIDEENRRRSAGHGWAGLRMLDIDLDCLLTLRAAGLSLRSVPAAGTKVTVKSTANTNGPADNVTVRCVSPELRADAALAAAVMGVRLAGVEVITTSVDQSLREAGGVVVEVNGAPGLQYHYLVKDPAHATSVAAPLLERLLAEGMPTGQTEPEEET